MTRGFKQKMVFLPGLSWPLIVKQRLVIFTFFYRITKTSHFQPYAEGQRLVIFSLEEDEEEEEKDNFLSNFEQISFNNKIMFQVKVSHNGPGTMRGCLGSDKFGSLDKLTSSAGPTFAFLSAFILVSLASLI